MSDPNTMLARKCAELILHFPNLSDDQMKEKANKVLEKRNPSATLKKEIMLFACTTVIPAMQGETK